MDSANTTKTVAFAKTTDADYVAQALKPAALRHVENLPAPTEQHVQAKAAIVGWLESASVAEWMTAYKSVGLVGKHLTQEIVRMVKARKL